MSEASGVKEVNVFEEMAKRTWLTDEQLEEQLQQSRDGGKLEAYQHAERHLRQLAGTMFAEGKDEKARLVRALADDMKKWVDPLAEKAKERAEAAMAAARQSQ